MRTATAASHALLVEGKPLAALKALCVLKAVGPATASAILSLQSPSTQAFMSDEAVEIVGGKKGEYTVKAHTDFASKVEASEWEGGAEELERACYAIVAGKRLGVGEQVMGEEDSERPKKRRKK